MKKRITTYTFDASAKTITFSGPLEIEGFSVITNVVDNIIIYQFNDPLLGGTFATNTLTLTYNTASMSDTDELMILYDDGVETQVVSGMVTANAGTNLNTSTLALEAGGNLAAIKAKTDNIPAPGQALAAASTPVVLPAAQITTLTPPAAITGFATSAKQDTIIGHIDGVEALLTTIEGNQLPDGHNVTVDNVSLPVTGTFWQATQPVSGTVTANTGLSQPLTDTQLRATAVPVDLGVNLDIRDLANASDSVAIYGSDDGGTTKRIIKTDAGGAIQVDLEVANVTVNNGAGASAVNIQDGGNAITVDGTITANAGTNLNTSSLALETGGNLASIKTNTDKIPALGQALAAASTPVVLTAAQVTTLTPPAAITGFSTETTLASIKNTDGIKKITDALPTGTNSIGKISDITTSIVPGVGATNLGKAKSSPVGATDTGVAILAKLTSVDAHSVDDEGDYDTPSLTDFHELRVRDQRSIDLANCNTYTDYTVLGNDTINLANSANHVFGSGAVTFDKVNGAANTVYAGIFKSFTAINLSEIFESGAFVGMGCYLSSLTNVVNVFLRIGTDASNYNCWTWATSNLQAGIWMNLRTAAAIPDYSKSAGNGWNTGTVSYVAFGVEFNSESNALAGILVDHVHIVGGRVTSTDITTSTSSTVNTPNININKIAGTTPDVNNGTVSAGTQRVTIASDSTGQIKLAAGTALVGKVGIDQTTPGTTNKVTVGSDVVHTIIDSGTTAVTNAGITTIAGAVAGTEMQVDVLTMPTTTVQGTITANLSATDNAVLDDIAANQTDASQKSQIVDGAGNVIGATSNALDVNIKSGSSSGVQYTEGDIDASVTGTAAMMEGAANTLLPIQGTVADGLLVNLGGNNDVTVASGAITETNSGAIKTAVELIDNAISGTEMQVDIVSSAAIPVTQSGTWDEVGINDSGNSITVDNPVISVVGGGTEAAAQRVTIANDSTGVLSVDDNGGALTVDGTVLLGANSGVDIGKLTANQSVNNAQINGVTPLMGAGNTGTGSQRVTIATDQAAVASKAAINTYVDGAIVTIGAKADAKSTATDTTAVTAMQVLKQISYMEQNPASTAVTNAGTFATQATLAAETTKVIGTVNVAASQTIAATQATAANLNMTEVNSGAIKTAVEVIDNAISGSEMQVDVVAALPAGTNIIGKTGHDITGVGHGVKTVTTAGTDLALATSTACKKVDIQAQTDNTGLIAVGGSGVDATIATGTGILLEAGDIYSFEIDNLADMYIDSTVNGEGVRYTYYT